MPKGSSETVRRIAEREYVRTATCTRDVVEIRVGDLEKVLRKEGFPAGHVNQICTSLESEKFWRPLGMQMLTAKGQPRKVETVFKFSFSAEALKRAAALNAEPDPLLELAGALKGAIREGAAAFVRELRRDKETPGSHKESAA